LDTRKEFAERSKILLDTDLKIILLDHQNDFVETLKTINNTVKNFDILATSLSVLRNYFDSSTKLLLICIQLKFFRSFSKTVLSVYRATW